MFGPITSTSLSVMKPNPSRPTHGDMGWGGASFWCYPKIMSRSSQGQSIGKSAQKGWKLLVFALIMLFEIWMMVETHLGPNTEIHKTHVKSLEG